MSDSSSETQQPDGEEKTPEPTLSDDVQELLKEIRSHSRRLSRAKNLLKGIANNEPRPADYEAWLEVHQGLDGYELGIAELDELREKVVSRLGSDLQRLRVKARMKFLTKVNLLADQADIEVEKISEAPLVLYLRPLTFEIDFEEGGVRMLYGHELIDDGLSIDAAALLEARKKALSEMTSQGMESEDFFDLLRSAYRTVLVADGAEAGERIDLVDVLVPLSLLRAKKKSLRAKGPEALKPFSRHLLAWQLAKLRRHGMLERDGMRLDLGAATGGSTRNKSDVLYIPVGSKSGQYYGSLRFEKA